jgi:hypothetical protein
MGFVAICLQPFTQAPPSPGCEYSSTNAFLVVQGPVGGRNVLIIAAKPKKIMIVSGLSQPLDSSWIPIARSIPVVFYVVLSCFVLLVTYPAVIKRGWKVHHLDDFPIQTSFL